MTGSGTQVHKQMNDLEGAFRRLEKDERVIPENKVLITRFANTWLSKGFTRIRIVKLIYITRYLASFLGKSFENATKEDLVNVVAQIEAQNYSEATRYDFKAILKMFYRWLKGDEVNTPKEIAWLRPRMRGNGIHKLPEELLTEKEIEKMAATASNYRERALVLTLYESGCRIGEILSLKRKNIQFDQHGAVLRVTGKTGDRRVRIISSSDALNEWLTRHPQPENPEAWVWPGRANNYDNDETARHRTAYKTLVTLAKKAGIKKKVHPHLFRHSRATELANKLTEAQMKEHFGWTQSSAMASVYVHLSGRNVDDALFAIHEKKTETKTTEVEPKPVPIEIETPQPSENDLKIMLGNPEFKRFLMQKIVEYKSS